MTGKQKQFAMLLAKNPTMTQAEAVRQTYDITNPNSARSLGAKLVKNPAVMEYMQKNARYAEKAVVQVLKNAKAKKDDNSWQRLTLDSANSILDRVHGKATQRVESTSTSVNLNLSLNDITQS